MAENVSTTTPIKLTSEHPREKLKEITEKLEQGIKDLFASERFKDYLDTMAKFHQYSYRNVMLILMQNPNATQVAGYNAWKTDHNREVKKGEKGIKIIAYAPYDKEIEQDVVDPKTKKPILDENGQPKKEKKKISVPSFKVASVFDVAQTEGDALPELVTKLTANVENYKDFISTLRKISPCKIKFEDINEKGTNGIFHHEENYISIQKGLSEAQTIKTAIHEIAHAKIHKLPEKDGEERPDRNTREVQAEAIAYAVCQYFGIDTSDYSLGYITLWSKDKEAKELASSLDIINKTATNIINDIEKKMPELVQTQEQTEQTPPKEQDTQEPIKKPELSPEVKAEVDNAVKRALQTFIDVDITKYGSIQANTLEAVKVQGFTYENDKLIPQPTDKKMTMESVVDYIGKLADKIDKADITKTTGIATFNVSVKRLETLNEKIPPRQIKLRRMIDNAVQSPDLDVLKQRMSEICDYAKTIEIEPKKEQTQSKAQDKADDKTQPKRSYTRRDKTAEKTEKKPSIRGKIEKNKAAIQDQQTKKTKEKSKGLEVS